MKTIETLAVDLGNTLVKKGVPIDGAFRVMRRLIGDRFGNNTHIISRVDEEQEKRARAFVTSPEFVREVSIPLSRVHFCRERSDKGKICGRLGVTHMIDDRPEVMIHLPNCVRYRILFDPTDEDLKKYAAELSTFHVTRSWSEIEGLLLTAR